MPAQYLSAKQLLKLQPYAECCHCGKELAGDPGKEIWALCDNNHIYCSQCANSQNGSTEA